MRRFALKKTQRGKNVVEVSKEGQQSVRIDGDNGRKVKRNTGFK
jgi:hypothetical protein